MRITFILHHADMSGGVKVVAIYARELMKQGHELVVISTPWPGASLKDKARSIVYGRPWPQAGGTRPSHLDGSGVRHIVLDRFRPVTDADVPDGDVVIATWWETAEWVAGLSKSKGAKAYLIQHYETWGGPADRVDATWQLPLHKIVISKWLAELARERFGDLDVSHVPNSVDRGQFDAPPRGKQAVPTVGMLYSPTPFKGVDVGLKALERVKKELPSLLLRSFGISNPSTPLPLPEGAIYTQNPAQDRIKEIYAACDVWLCPSRSEGFHLPPLEAMACRCPVVSTRVGGPMDTVEEGVNGFLVDVGGEQGLANALLRLLQLSDSDWRKMSDAAYATASRYSWQDACIGLERALQRARDVSRA